jgi:tetratricopeptide (TPR) repeat protein
MPTSDLPARTSLWQWLQVGLLAANLWWTTLCLGGYRPETMVVTSALTGLLLIVHFGGLALRANRSELASGERRAHPAGWWLLPFLIYAAANAAWITPVPWLGWDDWLKWAQMIAVFWVMLNGVRSSTAWSVLFGGLFALAAIAVGLACYQRFVKPDWMMLGRIQAAQFIGRASGPFGPPNSFGAFLLLLLPPAGALAAQRGIGASRRLLFGGLTLFLAIGLVLTISRGAWLGLAIALAAWPMFRTGRSWVWRLRGAALVLGLLLAVGFVLYSSVPEVRYRLDALVKDSGERSRPIMWRGAWSIFREHPTWGGGAGGFNVLFEKYRPEDFQDEPQWAHNDYLNTLCDYGAVGFLLFFGACGLVAFRSSRGIATADPEARVTAFIDDPNFRRALGIALLAFALQLFVDFHFKIPALAMIFATISALLVQRGWAQSRSAKIEKSWSRIGCGTTALGVAFFVVCFVWPHYAAEADRYGMRHEIDRVAVTPVSAEVQQKLFQRGREVFARATEIDPSNAQAWSDRAYATALWSIQEKDHNVEAGKEAETYANRALTMSKVLPEFWLRRGVALDMQGRWVDAGDAFIEALRLAPASSSVWYYQGYHLSLQPSTHAMAVAAIATSLRLDPGKREAEALRQRLATSD